MIDRNELIKALWLIYSTCTKYEDCCKCPLRTSDDSSCYMSEKPPVKWEMNKVDGAWRAFYD